MLLCLLHDLVGNGMEEIVDLQVSLASLKDECVKLEREDQRKAIQPVIDSCLSACCEIAWTARHIKVETKMQTEQVHAEIKPLSDKLQAQGMYCCRSRKG